MFSTGRFGLLLILFPVVNLQLSPGKNIIWTIQTKNTTRKLLGFVSGVPLTGSRRNVTVQTLPAPLANIEPYSLTFDYKNTNLYFSNLADSSYYKINLSNHTQPQITAVHCGFAGATQFSMDWSTGNLYWVDYWFSWIAMKSVTKSRISDFKIVLESDMENPRGLALDPTRGYMFWTEKRRTPIIGRAGLDGTDRRVIAVGGLINPKAMTIDVEAGKIYWVDSAKDTLESCLNDGRERRIVKIKAGRSFTGVAYYKNTLFVTDDKTKQVLVIREETGIEQLPFRNRAGTKLWSIIVYAGELQPRLSDPCSKLKCEHFCVRTMSSARCLCQDGYTLSADGFSCTGSIMYSPRLFAYANKSQVCFVDIRIVFGANVSASCPVKNGTNITAVVSDPHRRVVYYADRGRNEIYSISLRTGQISRIVSNASQVEGLSFDWLTNTIYWTDSLSKSIESLAITTKIRRAEKVAALGNLGRVAIDPFSRQIFWITTKPARIMVKGYDSKDSLRILVNNDINRPADIHCDPVKQRVFWTDLGSIKVVNMDGTGQKKLMSTFDSQNQGLVLSKSFVFWTSLSSAAVLNAGRIERGRQSHREIVQSSSGIVDVDVLDISTQETTRGFLVVTKGVCFGNGECDHYCVPNASGRECRCELGYELQVDGQTCTTEFLQREHILLVDTGADRFYQVDMNSNQIFGSFLVNRTVAAAAVDPNSLVLYWSDSVQKTIHSSYLNFSSVLKCSCRLGYSERLVVDATTGNIFYSVNRKILGRSYIAISSPDGKYQKRLITGLDSPRAIELHSSQGIMFWSDYNKDPHIGRASMDGSQRETIISTNIKLPTGIAVDIAENLLYWADASRNVIEHCSFYGANRKVILKDSDAFLTDLVLEEVDLYYTAFNRPGITVVNKVDGSNKRILAESLLYIRLSDLLIVQPNVQKKVKNACSMNNGGCSTLCLPSQTGKTCSCADGIDLQTDGLTCAGATSRALDTTPGYNLTSVMFSTTSQRTERTTTAVTTGIEIETTFAANSATERQVRNEVIIASITAGTIVIVAVLVVVTVVLVRKRQTKHPADTVVYSGAKDPAVSALDNHNNDYSYICETVPPPIPPDHPPAYIYPVKEDGPTEIYLTPD